MGAYQDGAAIATLAQGDRGKPGERAKELLQSGALHVSREVLRNEWGSDLGCISKRATMLTHSKHAYLTETSRQVAASSSGVLHEDAERRASSGELPRREGLCGVVAKLDRDGGATGWRLRRPRATGLELRRADASLLQLCGDLSLRRPSGRRSYASSRASCLDMTLVSLCQS